MELEKCVSCGSKELYSVKVSVTGPSGDLELCDGLKCEKCKQVMWKSESNETFALWRA